VGMFDFQIKEDSELASRCVQRASVNVRGWRSAVSSAAFLVVNSAVLPGGRGSAEPLFGRKPRNIRERLRGSVALPVTPGRKNQVEMALASERVLMKALVKTAKGVGNLCLMDMPEPKAGLGRS